MPIQVDCPECKGDGGWGDPVNSPYQKCKNCKDGTITVYTQEELDKAVEAEREAGLKYCSDTERMLTIEGDTMPSQASVANMLWELIRSRSK